MRTHQLAHNDVASSLPVFLIPCLCEGVHHLAFHVTDTTGRLDALQEQFGWPTVQRGKYGDASGEYAYVDCVDDLKVMLETLESYR